MKKAIAFLASPKNLADFVWYYATYGKDYIWDASILKYGDTSILKPDCEKSGIFANIYDCEPDFWKHKMLYFPKLILIYLFRQKKRYSRKIIEQMAGHPDDYDLALICMVHHMSDGAVIELADRRRTVMLEDGSKDYLPRTKRMALSGGNVSKQIAWALLGRMQYMDITGDVWLEHTKYCDKYCGFPERMQYTNYKSISKLNDFSATDMDLYSGIIKKIYDFDLQAFKGGKCILLMTSPYVDFKSDPRAEVDRVTAYIESKYGDYNIYVKKHPRDDMAYHWSDKTKIYEFPQKVPAELILNVAKFDRYVLMFPSTTMMSMESQPVELLRLPSLNSTEPGVSHYDTVIESCLKIMDTSTVDIVYL